jgi:hypothetical protein
LYHVGTWSSSGERTNNLLYSGDPQFSVDNPRCLPPDYVLWSREEVRQHLVDEQIDFVQKATGLLVTTKDGRILKIVPPCYLTLRGLRGNEPSCTRRMVGLWRDDIRRFVEEGLTDGDDHWSCMKLVMLFPELKTELNRCFELIQTRIPNTLADGFIKRYQRGGFLYLEKPEHTVLEATRKYYRSQHSLEDNIRYQMSRVRFDVLWELVQMQTD